MRLLIVGLSVQLVLKPENGTSNGVNLFKSTTTLAKEARKRYTHAMGLIAHRRVQSTTCLKSQKTVYLARP